MTRQIAGLVVLLAALAVGGADAHTAGRHATHAEQLQIAAAVKRAFGKPPGPPVLTVVLYPICISTVDHRFASVVADPVQPSGAVAQPGYFYLRRTAHGFRVLSPLLTAVTALDRPKTVPVAVYRDFDVGGTTGRCTFQGAKAVKRALRDHTAPAFRV